MDLWALLLGIGTIALAAFAVLVGSLFRTPMPGTERALFRRRISAPTGHPAVPAPQPPRR
ncbi:hypothetical protein RCH12_001462 [Cryobacterium sp. MP_3.1]|uniref:hypothetical protein n=1 Tax=Cryobacterium sp. MP_3.1 TaxID=3071711 RepID=UPI002E036807|nr:hypothetical protein [Cryobacterium sp. MP_3.1]